MKKKSVFQFDTKQLCLYMIVTVASLMVFNIFILGHSTLPEILGSLLGLLIGEGIIAGIFFTARYLAKKNKSENNETPDKVEARTDLLE